MVLKKYLLPTDFFSAGLFVTFSCFKALVLTGNKFFYIAMEELWSTLFFFFLAKSYFNSATAYAKASQSDLCPNYDKPFGFFSSFSYFLSFRCVTIAVSLVHYLLHNPKYD